MFLVIARGRRRCRGPRLLSYRGPRRSPRRTGRRPWFALCVRLCAVRESLMSSGLPPGFRSLLCVFYGVTRSRRLSAWVLGPQHARVCVLPAVPSVSLTLATRSLGFFSFLSRPSELPERRTTVLATNGERCDDLRCRKSAKTAVESAHSSVPRRALRETPSERRIAEIRHIRLAWTSD